MQTSAKNWYRNKETIFFLIHKSVNTGTEWNFAEGSQSAEVMNFSLSKVTCIKKMREIRLYTGSLLMGHAQRQFKTSSTNSAICQRSEYCKDYCVQLHLKHFLHYPVDICCMLYPHIYTCHSKTARGLLFFSIDEYIRNCMLVICNIKFMNLYILFMWMFSGCNSRLVFNWKPSHNYYTLGGVVL